MRAYVNYDKLMSESVFIKHFLDEIAGSMAELFVANLGAELVERVRKDVEAKLAEVVSEKMLGEVMKKIDITALTNSVLLAAGARQLERLAPKG